MIDKTDVCRQAETIRLGNKWDACLIIGLRGTDTIMGSSQLDSGTLHALIKQARALLAELEGE